MWILVRFKCGDFNVTTKAENTDLQTLLDENSVQSTSELDRELNVNHTIVIKRIYICCLNQSVSEKKTLKTKSYF